MDGVAPLVGAWIEMFSGHDFFRDRFTVAPLVGAWIEILMQWCKFPDMESLPSWERGLK